MEQDIHKLLDEARNSISDYCINVCNAGCCRKGFLGINSIDELKTITQNTHEKLIEEGVIEKVNENKYYQNFNKKPCVSLTKDFLCSVHKDKNRPILCKDYPLFKAKNFIISSSACPAVTENKFEEYFKKIEKLGFKIV